MLFCHAWGLLMSPCACVRRTEGGHGSAFRVDADDEQLLSCKVVVEFCKFRQRPGTKPGPL